MATLDTARFWVDSGISVIPLLHKSKLPAQDWREYQTRLPQYSELNNWFSTDRNNMGIVCGGEESLVVLDFDSMAGYVKFINEKVLKTAKWKAVFDSTYRVKTHRGMHVYLKCPQKVQSTKIVSDKIDIRSYGNMVVAPPSIHPSGSSYSELTKRKIVTVDCIDDILPVKLCPNSPVAAIPGDMAPTMTPIPGDIFDQQINRTDIRTIKGSFPILDFVSRYSHTKRTSADGRWWMARCIDPQHNDKSPSLRIDAFKNRVKCLSGSCRLYHDIGFDVIDLYSILTGMSRKDSIRYFSSTFL